MIATARNAIYRHLRKAVPAPPPKLTARLKSVVRGFAGDNALYECSFGPRTYTMIVAVGWALMTPHETTVFLQHDNGDMEQIITYREARYVQPAEALARLGYEVSGTVDFAAAVEPVKEAAA